MEEILWRFPHIWEQIFNRLSNQSLAKSKTVSKTWNNFITNEKFYKLRVNYEMIQKDKDENGKTQLHKKAIDGELSEFKLIIDNVENKNPTDEEGFTPLDLAAKFGHLNICQIIIAKIVDKNPADKNGWTPLHLAAQNGHLDVCRSWRILATKIQLRMMEGHHFTVLLEMAIRPFLDSSLKRL